MSLTNIIKVIKRGGFFFNKDNLKHNKTILVSKNTDTSAVIFDHVFESLGFTHSFAAHNETKRELSFKLCKDYDTPLHFTNTSNIFYICFWI